MSRKLLNLCLASLLSVVSTAAWALSEVNGVYQIGTADDLVAFAELVNGENPYANAVLTADIVKPATDVSMIGRDGQNFQGTFDGAGHTITINAINNVADGTAIFRYVGADALIKDLKVQGTITTEKKYAGGIAAWNRGTIRGCYVDVVVNSAVTGDGTHAGIAGVCYQGTMIENCLAKFVIKGATTTNSGGIVGWCDGRTNVINCLVINDGSEFKIDGNSGTIGRNDGNLQTVNLSEYIGNEYDKRPSGASTNNYATNAWGNTKCVTIVPYDGLADGRICYQLNTDQSHIAWVQNIGTDEFPVPAAFGTGQVYASDVTGCDGKSEGELTFSNSGTAQAAAHEFDKFGICSVCGCFNFYAQKRPATNGSFLIQTPEDIDLAEGLNRIQNGGWFTIKMGNDITYVADPGRYIFNTGNWFDGNFNGDGHALTIEMSEMGENASFMPKISGTFENVVMHGKIGAGGKFAASVTSHTYRDRAKIRNVFSDIEICPTLGGDNTSAGLIGVAESKTLVDNCIYAGNIKGTETTECLAGLCGWSSGQTYFNNCAFTGVIFNGVGDSKVISRNQGNVTCENVYAVPQERDYGDNDKFTLYEGDLESGELAFFLNGKQSGLDRFYQKIGEDLLPSPIKKEGALVYADAPEYRCDGKPIGDATYTNTAPSPVLPPHTFENGVCQVCGTIQEDYYQPVDGWFEISTPSQLIWWSNYASTHLNANAKLTADIDMAEYNDTEKFKIDGEEQELEYTKFWGTVGTETEPFYGSFDGQFHTISNLKIVKPTGNGVGLVAVMNSLPYKAYGGISDADARAAEGVFIKNVVLDESCSMLGHGYIGIVGMTANWAGHVNISGLMMCGNVRANGGPNASGVFGCVMGSSCHVTINNSGMVGNVYGPKENGSFSGWLGSYADVTNCYAVGSVQGIQDDDHYFARHGDSDNIHITNCYARFGTQVPTVSEEDFKSGALAWRANGNQFRTGYWYQDIGTDDYPYPYPSHGTVIYGWTEQDDEGNDVEKYFSVANDDELAEVASEIKNHEAGVAEGIIATKAIFDELAAAIEALDDATTLLEFADAIDTLNVKKDAVAENAEVYKAYIAKCEEIKNRLATDNSFHGDLRDALEAYLDEQNYEEPNDVNPLGSYDYIVTEHVATAEEIAAETERVVKWLADAIAEDYAPGTDISNLIPNSDFSKQREGWTGAWSTGYGQTTNDEGQTFVGVEAWNATGDQYQTVEDMKPGYYLVGVNAAFRPSNNRYSTNYAAGIYANGIFNYFPTVIEDPVPVDEAEDGVNCNLTIKSAYDLKIYEDGKSTSGEDSIGFVVHGETGMAIAAKAGRYQVYTIAKVGEDGKLTIGIKNPGTKYDRDWTGWGPLTVTYCGEDGEEALDKVINNMIARAATIMDYIYDEENAAASPNFPVALQQQVSLLVSKSKQTEGIEAKETLVKDFSDLFQAIYESKQAYVALFNTAKDLENIEGENLPLVEWNEEAGEYVEIENSYAIPAEDAEVCSTRSEDLFEMYMYGSASTEEALAAVDKAYADFAGILPQKDNEGFFLIGSPKELVAFRSIAGANYTAKGKLTADIDMTGIGMQPINRSDYSYRGTFDGQGHAITNVIITHNEERTGLFNTLDNATVKNLKLTGDYYSDQKFAGGIAGYTYKALIQTCDVDVNIHSAVAGDGTHGGLIGNNAGDDTVVENCIVRTTILGEGTNCCGGVIGWSGSTSTVRNTLILSQGHTIDKSNGCHTISRNDGNCTMSNNFYVEAMGTAAGTQVTAEQLASGDITYKLNGSSSENPVWFQTLDVDATPRLFDGDVVYLYGGQYVNEKPNPQLNAFAYNVEANVEGENIVVTYYLNAEAEQVRINFYNTQGTLVYMYEGATTYVGANRVSFDKTYVGSDPFAMTYEVAVFGKGTKEITKVGESYKFNSPYGLAVNNNPASKGFGQVLITETRSKEDREGMFSTGTPGALFAFDAAFKPVGSYYGGLDIAGETPLKLGGEYELDLKDLRFSEDGRLFVGRASGTSASSVWEINPDDLDEAWTPVFTEGELDEATGITYVGDVEQNRMAAGLALEGKGDNLKMYVLGVQTGMDAITPAAFNCAVYNLGASKQYNFAAPSGYVEGLEGKYAAIPTHVGIHEDGQGGLWFIQNASQVSEETPAIKHFDAQGNEDYSDASTATHSGKMALTTDGKYIAIPKGNNKLVIYETNYVPMQLGMLYLDPKYNISTTESSITGIAFDYANNLYVASSGSKTLSRYAIPSWNDNKTVTPGNAIGTALPGDVNKDKKVDAADAEFVLTLIAADQFDAIVDFNADGKVDAADLEFILSIIAGQ